MNKSPVTPSYLKQVAKKIKKEKDISHHQALDEAAMQLGHSNYKNYLNALEEHRPKPQPATEEQIEALRLDKQNEVMKRLNQVVPLFENFTMPFQDLLSSLNQSRHSKNEVQLICDNSGLKKYLELYFLIESLRDEEGEIDDYAIYHIPKTVELKNLVYKFKKDRILVEGEYDLKLEFGFDYDKGDKHPTFKDEEMFGSFELSIDANKEINVDIHDIGHYL